MSTTCFFQCIAYGGDADHPSAECPEAKDASYEEAVQAVRTMFKFDRYSGCFTCGMPQELCQTFVRTSHGMTKSRDVPVCTYGRALFEAAGVLIANLYRTRQRRNRLWRELGIVRGSEEQRTQQGKT